MSSAYTVAPDSSVADCTFGDVQEAVAGGAWKVLAGKLTDGPLF
jgi:hypothetical protein